jgi:hypothetical protein
MMAMLNKRPPETALLNLYVIRTGGESPPQGQQGQFPSPGGHSRNVKNPAKCVCVE